METTGRTPKHPDPKSRPKPYVRALGLNLGTERAAHGRKLDLAARERDSERKRERERERERERVRQRPRP